MTTNQGTADVEDPRWHGRVPWNLRHPSVRLSGDLRLWLSLVAERIESFFTYNEPGITNLGHFAARLKTETFGEPDLNSTHMLGDQLKAFFDLDSIVRQADHDVLSDPEETEVYRLRSILSRHKAGSMEGRPPSDELQRARTAQQITYQSRVDAHRQRRFGQRVAMLEAVLRLSRTWGANEKDAAAIVDDIRRMCVRAHVPLDIRGKPPEIVFIEEPLLQQQVVEPLLTRLEARWPARARELIGAYHDMLARKPFDEVFANSFKTLEEIGRSVTKDSNFDFSQADLMKHFPDLHPTIRTTIQKLRDHRGDEGAHGRKAPDGSEIRYLLFSVCNIALLILDYQASHGAR